MATTQVDNVQIQQILTALKKPPLARSYDDLLLLKSYISKTEFITKDLAGVVNPRQMNDICRSLSLENVDAGEMVFNQGDNGDKVYIILTGKCEVRIRYRLDLTQGQSEIREKSVGKFTSGQYFGERALKFDEPRSASVLCLEKTSLLTLSKSIYLEVLEDARREDLVPPLRPEQLGTKEGVIKILSKVREKRTPQELDGVASYLYRRIPFFQKFSMQQLIELCRVADSITIWGRSILFKQGQMGQAFYVILTGTVEVWVTSDNMPPPPTAPHAATHTNTNTNNTISSDASISSSTTMMRNLRGNDLTEGLGAKVNQLVTGDVFGERALENETSQRMASIITGEDNTELIVISKEDYHNLVYVMMHSDSMHKLQVLRRTELFHSLDIVHLRALSRFMEPRKFQIDEEIHAAGKKATELIIIEKGEGRVVTEIQEGYEKLSAEQKYKIHHRRYMDVTAAKEIESPIPTDRVPSPRRASTKPGATPQDSHQSTNPKDKVAQVHKLLRHTTESADEDELLALSTKEIRKKSLMFAEKLKESLGAVIGLAEGNAARPNTRDGGEGMGGIGGGAARRNNMNRFRSMDMNLIGKRKKIDLGRIAPNSILSANVLGSNAPHQDVFHPETVIAASLVTAYAISKHEFFNHMPKDSLEAIIKVIKEYKPPVLNPLWENAPRVLDENQWKMEKVWERYRNQISKDIHKDVNILDAMKVIQRRHISSSSGNDPHQKFVSRMEDWGLDTQNMRTRPKHKEVDLNWGLPEKDIEFSLKTATNAELPANQNKNSNDDQLVTRLPFSAAGGNSEGNNNRTNTPGRFKLEPIHTQLADFKMENIIRPVTPSAAILNTVSNIIRNRISRSQSNANFQDRGVSRASSADYQGDMASSNASYEQTLHRTLEINNRGAIMKSPSGLSPLKPHNPSQPTVTSFMKDPSKIGVQYPFSLIHIHREIPHANPIQYLGEKRRLLKSYLRVNGIFKTCSKAKQMADTLMEQLFITLYQSTHLIKENELVLQWNTFKGYESIDVHDTDLFFIYCRSIPIEFASLKPAKNIFNAKFPSLCKPINQRFAVIVMNELNEQQTIQQASRMNTALDPKRNEFLKDLQDAELHNVYHDPPNNPAGYDSEDEEQVKKLKDKRNRSHLKNSNNNKKVATSTQQIPINASSNNILSQSVNSNSNSNNVARRSSEFSPSEMTQLKIELLNNGLNVNDFLVKRKNSVSATAAMPLYLKEISIVYEVLSATSTRLDSVRSAIHRFGSMERIDSVPLIPGQPAAQPRPATQTKSFIHKSAQSFMNNPVSKVNNQMNRRPYSPGDSNLETISRVDTESGEEDSDKEEQDEFIGIEHEVNQPLSYASSELLENPFLKTRLYLKAFDSNEPDRILKLLFTENKRVCILPLFRWILINEDTLNTLNFLNIFDEASIKKIYLAEEFADYNNKMNKNTQDHLTMKEDEVNPQDIANDYTDIENTLYEKNVDPLLIKSFSEAGLLPVRTIKGSGSNTKNFKNNNNNHTQSSPQLIPLEKTRALEILQNEVISREISTSIHHMKEAYVQNSELRPSSPTLEDNNDENNNFNEMEDDQQEEEEEQDNLMLVNKSGGIMVDISELQAMTSKNTKNNSMKMKKNMSGGVGGGGGGGYNPSGNGSNSNNNNNNNTTNKAMLIEQRLKTLNSIASEQMKIVNVHEKLLVKESREVKKYLGENAKKENRFSSAQTNSISSSNLLTNPQSATAGSGYVNPERGSSSTDLLNSSSNNNINNNSIPEINAFNSPSKLSINTTNKNKKASQPLQPQNTAKNYDLMNERLSIIESLATTKTSSLTGLTASNNTISGNGGNGNNNSNNQQDKQQAANSGRPNAFKRYLQPPGTNKQEHQASKAALHQPENTAAGKRLADSLKMLSESLDAQYKK
jgi:CRP-like cAMP-binding protein